MATMATASTLGTVGAKLAGVAALTVALFAASVGWAIDVASAAPVSGSVQVGGFGARSAADYARTATVVIAPVRGFGR
jgi:hypothetical protein